MKRFIVFTAMCFFALSLIVACSEKSATIIPPTTTTTTIATAPIEIGIGAQIDLPLWQAKHRLEGPVPVIFHESPVNLDCHRDGLNSICSYRIECPDYDTVGDTFSGGPVGRGVPISTLCTLVVTNIQ